MRKDTVAARRGAMPLPAPREGAVPAARPPRPEREPEQRLGNGHSLKKKSSLRRIFFARALPEIPLQNRARFLLFSITNIRRGADRMARIIDGKAIAAKIRGEIAGEVEKLGTEGITPGLAVVLVGE